MQNQTVLKVNVSLQIVKQSGDEFLLKDIKMSTKNQIRKYDVGACYYDSKVTRSKSLELICDSPSDVINARDELYSIRSKIKSDLTSLDSGMAAGNQPLTVAELLERIHRANKTRENGTIKISPYSLQVKVTMQHIVPKDVQLLYPERYHENNNWYSSNTQVLEVRVPLVQQLDSKERLNEVFDKVIEYINELPYVGHSSDTARPTQDVIKELIGQDRFNKLIEEKKNKEVSASHIKKDQELQELFSGLNNDIQGFDRNPEYNRS